MQCKTAEQMSIKKRIYYEKVLSTLIVMFMAITIFTGCKYVNKMLKSNEELAEEVKESIIEEFNKDELLKGKATVKELTVIHKKENNYSGVLKTQVNSENISVDVDITFDGESIRWEISGEDMAKIKMPLIFSETDIDFED